jgi:hypothetical protein
MPSLQYTDSTHSSGGQRNAFLPALPALTGSYTVFGIVSLSGIPECRKMQETAIAK